MSKKKDIIQISLFVAYISVFLLLFIFFPKAEVSYNEKRKLETKPEFSFKALTDGSFEKNVEDYLTDHFPFREKFVSLNSHFNIYTGRNGVNEVYKGKDGYFISTPVNKDNGIFEKNIETISAFMDKTDVKASFIMVPQTGYVMDEKLPLNHSPYDDDVMFDYAKDKLLKNNVNFVDLREVFKNSNEQLYYKTDHHWTSKGAYEAYRQYDKKAKDESEFQKEVFGGFYGTLYSKSALWNTDSEEIEVWKYPLNVEVTISDGAEEKRYESMFFYEHLDEMDKYPVYLDGNHSFVRIKNKDCEKGKILILKDSYAHCFAPFLAIDKGIVDMVDLRHYLDSVSELIKAEGYDEILFVYGLNTLAQTTDINILE